MLDAARATVEHSLKVQKEFLDSGLEPVVQAAEIIGQAFANGNKLLICGNGGSAADAQHLAGELINRFVLERPPLPAIALTADTCALTAIANDYYYEEVFAKQIKGLGKKGDILLGISTSGRSGNVLKALAAAKNKGMTTLGLAGSQGGDMEPLCDLLIQAPSRETPRIQEIHSLVIHILCELIDLKLFGRTA